MKKGSFILCGIAALSLSGCATALTSVLTSDEDLAQDTAGIFGVEPGAVMITNRHKEGMVTYYRAELKGKSYACWVGGGGLGSFGMRSPPHCQPALGDNDTNTP